MVHHRRQRDVRLNEIEIVVEEQQYISNQEFHSHLESASCNSPTRSETDIDANDSVGESSEVNRKDILNCTDLDESFKMVKSLLHHCKKMTLQVCLQTFIVNAWN